MFNSKKENMPNVTTEPYSGLPPPHPAWRFPPGAPRRAPSPRRPWRPLPPPSPGPWARRATPARPPAPWTSPPPPPRRGPFRRWRGRRSRWRATPGTRTRCWGWPRRRPLTPKHQVSVRLEHSYFNYIRIVASYKESTVVNQTSNVQLKDWFC